jgi:aldehyde:ferredoxin oxidoreductase
MQAILTVDLTDGTIGEMNLPSDWEDEFLGGASLAARILYKHLSPDLDPLSPQAPLLILTGPLSGTAGPAVGRFVICGRSPATGLWAESNCGGFWGPELRKTGYDGMLLTGRALEPTYLWVHGGGSEPTMVELRKASHLWGLDTYQTQTALKSDLNQNKARIASIGPAGERLIPFSLILCDHGRVAGRTGMGAVMGSKNLKAIAVAGSGSIPVVNPIRYSKIRSQTNHFLRNSSYTRVFHDLGTAGGAEYFDYLKEMPKRYFQKGSLDEELKVSGSDIAETILSGVSTCHACVIACGRVVSLPDDRLMVDKRKGPEYETIVGFGPNLCINDPVVITRLGELCDRYGMDTISLSNTIGLAFTLSEKGVLDEEDTDGLELIWGDADVVEQMIHLTAKREGFGAHLAEGARSLARRFGVEDEAVQVNGLEIPYHDPRGASGMALVYATSPRGACHNQSDYFLVDIGQAEGSLGIIYFPALAGSEKAGNVARHQNWRTVFNSLVMCIFSNIRPQSIVELVNAACGLDWGIADLLRVGERGWNLKRAINNRLGLTRINDRLPKPLLKPYNDDPNQETSRVPDLEAMLEAYYQARGWDPNTGYPTRQKLIELNLDWIVEDLW